MAKKKKTNLTKEKAREMLHNPPHGKPLTEKQRKYFGAVASAQMGLSIVDPNDMSASASTPGKRARIIANSQYPEFREEYERTKSQYAKHYPGGVDFIEARGYEELEKAFGGVNPDEDLIMMAHHNKDAMYGVPVADPTFKSFDAPEGKTLATLFGDLQGRGYKGNCYLGICEGEDTAKSLQAAGVNIPIFGTPEGKKWYGANPGSKGSFEDFFFGVALPNAPSPGASRAARDLYEESPDLYKSMQEPVPINPKEGEDYRLLFSERQQELMNRRASGTPIRSVTPLKGYKHGGIIKDNRGQLAHPGEITQIDSNNITMKGVKKPLLGISNAGDTQVMFPEQDYKFIGDTVTEIPLQNGGVIDALGGASGIANTAAGLFQGFGMLQQERQNRLKAKQFLGLSNIVNQAAGLQTQAPQRRYVRPEDMIVDPSQLSRIHGTGTNYLAKNGKKLPSYQAGGFIPQASQFLTSIAGEGNVGNVGNMLGSFVGGGGGTPTGAGKIGSTAGSVIGNLIAPGVGGILGDFIGGTIGGAIGGNEQKQAEKDQQSAFLQLQNAAFQQGTQSLRNQYSAFMKCGGKVPEMNLGGELQVYDGNAEVISQNPYLPDGGETVMFKGASHAEGGIPIKFGKSPVEVEGGEPAVKLEDGGTGKDNLVVFGDMKIPSYGVTELNDPKAKGKKFKNYINELSKVEDKQTKIIGKGLDLINNTEPIDSFDKLKLASGKAMLEGANMTLKQIADKKKTAASIQNAILETAEQFGLKSSELAKGNIRKERKGKKAQSGGTFPFRESDLYGGMSQIDLDNSPFGQPIGAGAPPNMPPPAPDATPKEKFDWMTVVNSVLPYLRPTNQQPLDPNQLSGEMFALSTNQLEPVQAQLYQPLLESVSNISLQDQLNANQSDFNALTKLTAQNPAAQSVLAAQKYSANSAILGEEFRLNQDRQMGAFNRNRATLNDATLKNLAILDQQYVRQSQAKSNTKATAQAALSSISEKMARNKLENKTLSIYENLYNYRYDNKGRAYNVNPFAQFIVDQGIIKVDKDGKIVMDETKVRRDRNGMIINSTETQRVTDKKKNGGIIKAIKDL